MDGFLVGSSRPGRWARSFRQRLRALTARQAAVLALAIVVTVGTAVSAMAGLATVAVALLGAGNFLVMLGVLQLRRRLRQEIRSLTQQHAHYVTRVEAAQRRILAALENERLAAAERQQALLQALSGPTMGKPAVPPDAPASGRVTSRGR